MAQFKPLESEKLRGVWARLLSHSNVENDCLVWTASRTPTGYGRTSLKGRTMMVHRLSYMIFHNEGSPLEDTDAGGTRLVVAHTCGNRACFSPDHLKHVTIMENNFDDRISQGTFVRGTSSPSSKIDESMARKIHESCLSDKDKRFSVQKERAERLGVSIHTVRAIDSGRTWVHVTGKNTEGRRYRELSRNSSRRAKERKLTSEDYTQAEEKILQNVAFCSDRCNGDVRGDCWEWTGLVDGFYGRTKFKGCTWRTHALMCEVKYGRRRSPGEVVRHLCNNPICCNKEHLSFGSPVENARDTIKRGVTKRMKLTEEDVRGIRNSTEHVDTLAKVYNVSRWTIYDVRSKKRSWAHVQVE